MSDALRHALFCDDEAERRERLGPGVVDVSHLEGAPIGTLGSGHSVFGRSGFQRVNFGGPPEMYVDFTTPYNCANFAFYVRTESETHVLQRREGAFAPGGVAALPAKRVFSYAALPKSCFRFELQDAELLAGMIAFSPLVAHDLATSATPVQVFEISLQNRSALRRRFDVLLAHPGPLRVSQALAIQALPGGEIAFAGENASVGETGASIAVELDPGELATVRFFVAWYFPEFKTPSPAATASYRRWYTKPFGGVADVVLAARAGASGWSQAIDRWRDAFDVPAPMKRLWFSSLSVVMTSTLLSDDPYFFAIESPHDWVNTMDVAVYANWVYLVNWPELERLDLEQYLSVIPLEGDGAGFVGHSLWSDGGHYAEEPTFVLRLWRAYLWSGDARWLARAYDHALAAVRHAHARDNFHHLLNSRIGNQSYDEWMMPGASAYVNVAWLYALHALSGMSQTVAREASVAEREVHELLNEVERNLMENLWSNEAGGYFRCFMRTPGSSEASQAEAVFSDQLFGRWVALLDESSGRVLPSGHVAATLQTIYENNLLDDAQAGFRGWVNGMLPQRRPDLISGYHARTCWLGAQLNLAALLGAAGHEARSLDVFRSVEAHLGNHHIAAGEWNRSIDARGRAVELDEWGKDTPCFPPYPRYASSWEYLLRMLGLSVDRTYLYLSPFRSLRFELRRVSLAGLTLSIRVEPDWRRARVNGKELAGRVRLRRDAAEHEVEFVP
ncbi:MAG TPA: GH116 family glycosyl hydrolase [Polyangiaceae bacterium]